MDQKPNQSKPQAKKFFDIAPPGKTAPTPTSRPVIATNQPPQTDTMLARPVAVTQSQPEIVKDELPKEEIPPKSIPIAEPVAAENEMSQETNEPEKNPAVNEESMENQNEKSVQAANPVAEHLNEPLPSSDHHEDRNQFVVAHHSKPKSNKRNLIILIVLLVALLVIVVDLLLDAQIFKSTLPHTHFIKH